MKIALIEGTDPTIFERRLLSLDLATPTSDDVECRSAEGPTDGPSTEPDLIFYYGELPSKLPETSAVVSTRAQNIPSGVWPFRTQRPVPVIATEIAPEKHAGRIFVVPEAVEDEFANVTIDNAGLSVGYVERGSVRDIIQSVRARAERFRSDIRWVPLDPEFRPDELEPVSLFLDPAAREDDRDGGVAQAMVASIPVVAARTSINVLRTMGGSAGALVPIGDQNEMVHAILNQLFRPEQTRSLLETSNANIERFSRSNRMRHLEQAWRALL